MRRINDHFLFLSIRVARYAAEAAKQQRLTECGDFGRYHYEKFSIFLLIHVEGLMIVPECCSERKSLG